MTFSSIPTPLLPYDPNHLKTLVMVTQSGSSKRPICPSCSKPTRTCLCSRFNTSKIDNSVSITILQHIQEKKHPLNSTRIATLGLNNVHIISVSDVNFQANFTIHPQMGERSDSCENGANFRGFKKCPDEAIKNTINLDGTLSCVSNDFEDVKNGENGLVSDGLLEGTGGCTSKVQECDEIGEQFLEGTVSRSSGGATIDFTIEKYGVISSYSHGWMEKGRAKKLSFEKLMNCKETVDNLARGFVVKKLQKKEINGGLVDEESEEFEVSIPQGSVLLFPSEEALGIGDIDIECGVKNLIVLDGTWAKARRMYSENPWLKVLPHLKLDVDKVSLYREVRQQPKAGYLSTIESIVYSLKAVGNDCEGLDGLLDVFESMVGDQRRFKDERLNEEST